VLCASVLQHHKSVAHTVAVMYYTLLNQYICVITCRPYYLQDLRKAVVPATRTFPFELRGAVNNVKLANPPVPLLNFEVNSTHTQHILLLHTFTGHSPVQLVYCERRNVMHFAVV
jgi:hypothetical protein